MKLSDCVTLRDYGKLRGERTGHSEPTDKDFAWLGKVTDGVHQGTDPEDAVDFAAGMAEGAAIWQGV